VHWEIRETMTEAEVETIIQRAREQYPGEHPRIITDNGPQFIARDFKEFIRICGMTHVKTSPYYPQSNGKIERWFKTLKGECIRVMTPLSVEDARRLVAEFVTHYNTVRLHSAIAYITPADKLAGRAEAIWAARREKLAQAVARRRELAFHVVNTLPEHHLDPFRSLGEHHHFEHLPGLGIADLDLFRIHACTGPSGVSARTTPFAAWPMRPRSSQ
jgi:hypothetical protein